MGNYRFKLSDMMPNAWFYKLKDMSSKSRNHNLTFHSNSSKKKLQQQTSSNPPAVSSKERQPHLSNQRKSYHFSRNLTATPPSHDEHEKESFYDNVETKTKVSDNHYPEEPRKSSKKRRSTRRSRVANRASPKIVTSSTTSVTASAGCTCRAATAETVWTKPDSTPEEYPNSAFDSSSDDDPFSPLQNFDGMLSLSAASCKCRIEKDIVINLENQPLSEKVQESVDKVDGLELDTVSSLNLPPIITNPRNTPKEASKFKGSAAKFKESILESPPKGRKTTPTRRFSVNSQSASGGLKLRTNSPRIINRKMQGRKSVSSSSNGSSRKSMSDSFAVVKKSKDPQKDFRESMVEMIMENNISASKDLEDLLACYLSLNSDQYHDLIIKVFKQIWFDVVDIHHKVI